MFRSIQNVTVLRLATAQALSMTTMNINIINTALVGVLIAPLPWLATLALSLQFLTSMMTTLPASLLMARFGRRPVMIAGVLISSLSSFAQAIAVLRGDFVLFCAGGMGLRSIIRLCTVFPVDPTCHRGRDVVGSLRKFGVV